MSKQVSLSGIDAVILCGGLGKRLRPEIGERQKTLAEIQGQPFLDFLLGYLSAQGFKRVVLCTGYQADDVEKYYKTNRFGLEIVFSREREMLGTGGAIKNAEPLVHSNPFVALNGDCFCRLDYQALLRSHADKKADATLVVVESTSGKDFGSIELDPSDRIMAFKEKIDDAERKSLFISTGIYCFNRSVFGWMPKVQQFSIEKEFFPVILDKRVYGFRTEEEFIDIGTPERFKQAQRLFDI